MAIDLLAIQPHKVSRDLSGYVTYLYGAAKTGKTTLATRAGGALLLAFERGYGALPGVFPVDIASWGDVKAVVRDLKKPEVKEKFKVVIFDTIDIAGEMAEKYVCTQNGVTKISEAGAYGQGWNLMKREFSETVRAITSQGYAVFFISHEKDKEFTRKDGTKYNQIVPSCANSFNNIAKDLADIYAYAEKYNDNGVAKVKLILRSVDNSVDTGSRFKYMPAECEMSYEALVKAITDAIDKEAAEFDGKLVTDERETVDIVQNYDYSVEMNECKDAISKLMTTDADKFGPLIQQIIAKYLGKGKKVSEATIDQVELIHLINMELKEDLLPLLSK